MTLGNIVSNLILFDNNACDRGVVALGSDEELVFLIIIIRLCVLSLYADSVLTVVDILGDCTEVNLPILINKLVSL